MICVDKKLFCLVSEYHGCLFNETTVIQHGVETFECVLIIAVGATIFHDGSGGIQRVQ